MNNVYLLRCCCCFLIYIYTCFTNATRWSEVYKMSLLSTLLCSTISLKPQGFFTHTNTATITGGAHVKRSHTKPGGIFRTPTFFESYAMMT